MSVSLFPPPLDGPLSQRAADDATTIEAMAKVLIDYDAVASEREAIRALSSRGFGVGAVVRLTERAQARAQEIVAAGAARQGRGRS